MSIKVQIGNSIHEVPIVGENKWGEKTTDVILALAEGLSNLIGPADILIKETTLSNGVLESSPINGLRFDSSVVQNIIVNAVVVRTFPEALSLPPLQDSIIIEGCSFDGDIQYSVRYTGNNAGVNITCRNDGQFEYTSEDIPNTENIFIKFYAKAIVDDN